MMSRSTKVSIVIPVYNEGKQLRQCLDAIACQTVKPLEVILVDNNSIDNSAAIARDYPFVKVINEKRQGIIHARNRGFDAARGTVIGRIDADVIIPDNWVEHLRNFYDQKENLNCAWSGPGYFYNVLLPRLASAGYALMAFEFNKLLVGHYTVWGSNMALTVKQWRHVRGLVCHKNDIHEDLDLAIHLNKAGYKVVYDTRITTRARLKRVQSDRGELWKYLQLWPRTLRIHHRKTWVICWFFGAFVLYLASFLWLLMGNLANLEPARKPKISAFED